MREVYPDVSKAELDTRDPIERGFHKYMHGKGRARDNALNAQVERWLLRAKRRSGRQNFDDFAKFIVKKRDEVYLELYKVYQGFRD